LGRCLCRPLPLPLHCPHPQALAQAEADVRLLLATASSAAKQRLLTPEDVSLVARQGASLLGSCASLMSRLRAMQDGLSTLRG
jgi:hypothetical protein